MYFIYHSHFPKMFHTSFLLLLLLLTCFDPHHLVPCSAKKAPDISTDESALISFRAHITTTSSDDDHKVLENYWNVSTSVCDWIGVTCNNRHQRVEALDLHDMGLSGTISPHLGNLSFLLSLDISNNSFHGNLPKEMARLRRLKHIDISLNNIVGNIPSWFGLLPQLQFLHIWSNGFTGGVPTSLSNCSKLQDLDISLNPLSGPIPQEIGDLHNLKRLVMQENQLTGSIPPSIFNISSLELVDISINGISGDLPEDMCSRLPRLYYISLSNNELEGRLPSSLPLCSKLEILGLSANKFRGTIPNEFGNFMMLKELYLGRNNLHGPIPSALGNLTMLEMLSLRLINFEGVLPKSIGNLRSLKELSVGPSSLTGHVPANFFNISSLRVLSLAQCNLTGNLPPTVGSGLPNLEALAIGGNGFTGTISDSISNATKLKQIDISQNKLTGLIPGKLGGLEQLEYLYLGDNNFIISSSEKNSSSIDGLGLFITSLTSCRLLKELRISGNPLNSVLPVKSFKNLSTSLEVFSAYSCGMIGNIPPDIGNLSNLIELNLGHNRLVGSLPNSLHYLSKLQGLYVSDNSLSGSFPSDLFCYLPRLSFIDMGDNELSGSLPDCLGDNMNTTSLRNLLLGGNKFSSNIPARLWGLKDLLVLNLSSNSFSGHLSLEIGNLRAATDIDLSMNRLSGQVPITIGNLQTLAHLSLAHNNFQGSLPELLGNLKSMEDLDLSHNNFSGVIPKSLENLLLLKNLNLSFNQFSGEIPSEGPFKNLTYLSFVSNGELCGPPQFGVKQCIKRSSKNSRKRHVLILVLCVVLGIFLMTLILLASVSLSLRWRKKDKAPSAEDQQLAITHERISYLEIQRATNSFDELNLLGVGSFGSVYKCVFTDGRIMAVKVFNMQFERAFRSFNTECEMLRDIRHRNLAKIITSCTKPDFMGLVLEYMPNGSLDGWLNSESSLLDMKQRLDIMVDVASALDYLHNGYSVPVVHCDVKPSNVLLDEDMVAHVSDFGISKFLKDNGSIVQTNTLATIGYTAPEYGGEGLVSASCDVYSFGIMLMEVFTRKRPTDEMFNQDLSLRSWVNDSLPNGAMQVIDQTLLNQEEDQAETTVQCVSSILLLASNCSVDPPEERIKMANVLASLKKLRAQISF